MVNSMSAHQYVIGVDGGGTKTLGVIMTETEEVLGRASGPSSNIHSVPHAEVEETLRSLVTSLCRDAGIEPTQLDGICLGMAGCDSPQDRAVLQGFLGPIIGEKTQLTIINDAIVAARAVLGELHGLLLIAGTGSICFGWNNQTGKTSRCGGWGHLLSDEGSGYTLGMEAMRAILRGVDGRSERTSLEGRILGHFGMKEPRDLLQFVYGPKGTKAEVASLSRFVMEEDEAGDAAARRILDQQAALLAELVVPVFRALISDDDRDVPIGLWGGNLVHGDSYRARFLSHMNATGLPLRPVVAPDADAVIGAARHALSESGVKL